MCPWATHLARSYPGKVILKSLIPALCSAKSWVAHGRLQLTAPKCGEQIFHTFNGTLCLFVGLLCELYGSLHLCMFLSMACQKDYHLFKKEPQKWRETVEEIQSMQGMMHFLGTQRSHIQQTLNKTVLLQVWSTRIYHSLTQSQTFEQTSSDAVRARKLFPKGI